MKFTPEQRRLINARINSYRTYDYKRFGTKAGSITYSEYLELLLEQEGKCYWTGRTMTYTEGLPSDVSLDRLSNDKPHTKDNTVLCQKAINLGRNNATALEFTRWLHMMNLLSPALAKELTEANLVHLLNPV